MPGRSESVTRVVDKRGRALTALTRKQVKSFQVFERKNIEVAAGDQLLLTANRRQSGFRATNGEIVTVSHVDERGRVCLKDGRVVLTCPR